MNRLLVVEDDAVTSEMLRRYFEIVGYEVVNALSGAEATRLAKEHKPTVIILDIILPDMDGYEVCKRLRADETTDQIPIIFLTQKDDRRDRLDGLSLGADDYITKPFDMEELRLRVHNIIDRMGGTSLVDARTGLPSVELIKERLPRLLESPDSLYLDVQIDHFGPFTKKYGPVAGNQVIRTAAKIIADLLHEIDPINSFVGHPGDNRFLIAMRQKSDIERIEKELPERFGKRVTNFYDSKDAALGKTLLQEGQQFPLMAFNVRRVDARTVQESVGLAANSPEKPAEKEPPIPAQKSSAEKTVT